MLAETCPRPGCTMPLARSRSNRVICTSCGLDVVRAAAAPAQSTEEQPKAEEVDRATNGPCNSTAVVPARGVLNDAASAAVGEKLLQGWTLLEESCGNCGLPLLRDVAGLVVCVVCQRNAAGQASGSDVRRATEREGRELMTRGSVQVMGNGGVAVGSSVTGGAVMRDASPARREEAHAEEERNRSVPRVGGGGRRIGILPMEGARGGGTLPMATGTPEGHNDVGADLDLREELLLTELEIGRALRTVRRKMEGRRDVEGLRMMAKAIQELAKAVIVIKDARRLAAYED